MKTLALALAVAATAAALAQDRPAGVDASELRWEKAEGLPAGVMVARVGGKGLALDFLKFPAGTRVPPHWHSAHHVVTVVSGRLVVGAPGDDKGKEVGPGGAFRIPAKSPHWTMAREETVFSVAGDAPNDLHWVTKAE